MRYAFVLAACLIVSNAFAAQNDAAPPLLALITAERGGAGEQQTGDVLARTDLYWFRCATIAGDLHESETFVFLPDHATIEAIRRLASIHGIRSQIFRLSPAMTYNAARVSMRDATAFGVSMVYVRRGTTDRYVEAQTLAADLLRKADVKDESFVAYALEYGGETPAFLFITPLRTLRDLDIDLSSAHGNLFTPAQDRERSEILKDAVRSNPSSLLLRIR